MNDSVLALHSFLSIHTPFTNPVVIYIDMNGGKPLLCRDEW